MDDRRRTTDAKGWQKLALPLRQGDLKKGINLLSTSVFKDDSMKMLKNRVQSADQAPVRIQNKIVLLVSDCGP
jgi:pyrimidine operon attenuation protein/uracil phosphoribosyltransferase